MGRKKSRKARSRIRKNKTRQPKTLNIESLDPRVMLDASNAIAESLVLAAHVDQQTPVTSQDNVQTLQDQTDHSVKSQSLRHEVVFVDAGVEGQDALLADLQVSHPGVLREVVQIRADQDGLQQIADALHSRSDIDAIHVVSHGESAQLNLGNTTIGTHQLSEDYAKLLDQIGQSLSADADILIYGCDVGAGSAGREFVATLSQATGADVAASTDTTGPESLQADFDFEVTIGKIESRVVFSPSLQASFPTTLDLTGFSVAVASDGTASFDADDTAGNDSSASNGIVRSHDLISFNMDLGVNSTGATNPTITSTLPDGLIWTNVPSIAAHPNSGIFDSVTGAPGGDMRTIVMQLPDIEGALSTSIPVDVTALGYQNGTQLNDVQFTMTADGTAPIVSESFDFVISSAPFMDLRVSNATFIGVFDNDIGTEQGAVYAYSIGMLGNHPTRTGTDSIKGSAPIQTPYSFDIDLSNVSPGARVFTWGTEVGKPSARDGVSRNYEWGTDPVTGTTQRGIGLNVPAGRVNDQPNSIYYSEERSVADSGEFTVSPGSPGGTYTVNVTGADTDGPLPTRTIWESVLPAGDGWFSSGVMSVWVPLADIDLGDDGIAGTNDDGVLDISPAVGGFDPNDLWNDQSNYGAGTEPLANNFQTHTVVQTKLDGGTKRLAEPGTWRYVDTSTYWYSGDGVTSVGHQVETFMSIGRNQGVLPVSGAMVGDKFDNSAQKIVPIVDYQGENRSNTMWSRAHASGGPPAEWLEYGTDYIIEFGTGGAGGDPAGWTDWDSMGDAGLGDSETSTVWTEDPTSAALGGTADPETGVRDSITKWRMKFLRDMEPGQAFYGWVTMETTGRSTLDLANNPNGEIIADQRAYTADIYAHLDNPWRASNYNPATNGWYADGNSNDIYYGDRLTYVDAMVRIDKEVVDTGSGTKFFGGSTATFQLTPTVTIPGPDNGMPAQDVVVTDILPGDLTIVPDTVSPTSAYGNPVEYCIACDGTDWTPYYPLVGLAKGVRWDYGDVPLNTALPITTFDVLVPFDAPNGTEYENVAVIESTSDPSHVDWRDARAGLTAVQIAALSVNKIALTPVVAENSTLTYEVGVANVSEEKVIPYIDTVDLLPWDGDEDGSSFSGTFIDIEITDLDPSLDVYVTTASPTTLDNQDGTPGDGFADPGTPANAWYDAPGTGDWTFTLDQVRAGAAGAPAIGSITAIRVVSDGTVNPQLAPSASTEWKLSLTPRGNEGIPSDVYVNDMTVRTDPAVLVEPTFSGPATIKVVAPDVEVTKEVCVEETACDPTDDSHWTAAAIYTDDATPTWRILVENTGTSDLVDITVTDPQVPTGMTLVPDSIQASTGDATGFTPTWTLSLVPGDSQYLTFDTQVVGTPDGGAFENSVSVSAFDQFGQSASDRSSATITYTPEIGVAKDQVSAIRNASNPDLFDVTYHVTIGNTGIRDLEDIELTEDLYAAFGSAFVGLASSPTIASANLSAGASVPQFNASWNGRLNGGGSAEMFNGSSGLLISGDSFVVEYVVQINPALLTDPTNVANQVTASSNDGEATDDSDSGTDPDGDNEGEPGDNGTGGTEDPTPLHISDVRVAKQVNGPYVDNNNGTWTIPYQLVMKNTGTVDLLQPVLADNIQSQLGSAVFQSVSNVALNVTGVTGGTAPGLNGSWNGTSDGNILNGTGNLAPDDVVVVTFDLLVNGSALSENSPLTNQAEASGQNSDGLPVSDLSDDGSNPNSDNPTAPGDSGVGSTNDPTPILIPDIALAKQVVGTPTELSNGNFQVVFQLVLQNVGTVDLTNIQITEDLEMEFGEDVYVGLMSTPAITSAPALTGSVSPTLNGSWDAGLNGSGNTNIFNGGSGRLVPNDELTVRFTVEIDPDASGTSVTLENQATAAGEDSNGTTVTDVSDSGADPNTNNPSGPGDTGGPSDPTPLALPDIAVAKQVNGAYVDNNDGTWTIPYQIVLENNGTTNLTNPSIVDNIQSQLGPAVFSSVSNVALDTSGVNGTAPGINSSWNGTTAANALNGTGMLMPGDVVILTFDVAVNESALAAASPLTNQATGEAQGPSGVVSDLSDDGDNPNTQNTGSPGDTGTTDDPTPILLPNIGLAKQVVGSPVQLANENWSVQYQMVMQNTGTVNLTNLQLSEDLEIEFGSHVFVGVLAAPTIVSPPTAAGSSSPILDGSWNGGLGGSSNVNLFNGTSGVLVPNDSIVVRFTVEVNPDGLGASSMMDNQADASGQDPNGNTVTDTSDNGADANNGQNDPTPLIIPEIGVAKQINTVTAVTSGVYDVGYVVIVENTGSIDLFNLQLNEDLAAEFGTAFVSIQSPLTISASDATVTPTLDAGWDGATVTDFFNGTSGQLAPGQSVTLNFTVRVDTNLGDSTPPADYTNQVSAYGESATGTPTTDLSDDGTNPNTDNGSGGTDDPTSFSTPQIRSVKNYGTITPNADGTYTVPVIIQVENTGTVTLSNLSLIDDVNAEWGPALLGVSNMQISAVGGYSGVLPTVNPNWNSSDTSVDILNPSQSNETLLSGEAYQFTFDATIDPDAVDHQSQPMMNQADATGEGTDLSGGVVTVTDQSGFPTAVDPHGNDSDAPSILQIPEVRTSKDYVGAVANGENWDVSFDIVLENTGTTEISGLDLYDNLSTQWGDVFVAVVDVTIDDTTGIGTGVPPTVNFGATAGAVPFDGGVTAGGGDNLLNNDGLLQPGEWVKLTLTVTVDPDASGTSMALENQVVGAGDGPGSVEVTDSSDDGTNPNTTNTGSPGDTGTSNDPTPVRLPDISITKEVSGNPVELASGNFLVPYSLVLENIGMVALNNLQITEDMETHFGSGVFVAVNTQPSISSGPSLAGSTAPSFDTWDGGSNPNLFNGTSGRLMPGDSLVVDFIVEIDPDATGSSSPLDNQVKASGEDADGHVVTDDSDSGVDPNGSNPGSPGDTGSHDDPTPLSLPQIRTTKVTDTVVPNGDNYDVTFNLVLENTGTVDLTNVDLMDDLMTQLGTRFIAVTSVTMDDSRVSSGMSPTLNFGSTAGATPFDGGASGNAGAQLLNHDGLMHPGDSLAFTLTITVDPDATGTSSEMNNQTTATGQGPTGTMVTDLSDDGTDPNGPNTGWPGDTGSTNDPTPIQLPSIGVTKEVKGTPVEMANGNFSVTYRLVLENTGTVSLTNLQINEDVEMHLGIGVFAGVLVAPTISVPPAMAGSTAPTLATFDGGINGSPQINIFNGTSGELATGDSLEVEFTIEVDPNANGVARPMNNQVDASGTDQNNVTVTDASDSGSDANGTNTDAPGDMGTSNDPTPLILPQLRAAKMVVGTPTQNDADISHYDVTYQIVLENTGNQTLYGIDLYDQLANKWGDAFVGVESAPMITSNTLADEANLPTLNAGYVDDTAMSMFNDDGAMAPGETITIQMIVTVDSVVVDGQTLLNQSEVVADNPTTGTEDGPRDLSDDGDDPDGLNTGSPGDLGTTNDVTPVTLPDATIGLAKSVNSVSGATVGMDLTLKNTGNSDAINVLLVDDLDQTFGVGNYVVDSIQLLTPPTEAASQLSVNTGFNGNSDPQLLDVAANNTLVVGDSAVVRVVVTLTSLTDIDGPGPLAVGEYENTATVTSTDDHGNKYSDESTDGTSPDTNGDGKPDEMTPTPITVDPHAPVEVEKSVSVASDNTITYTVRIENTGYSLATDIELMDNLDMVFGPHNFTVDSITILTPPTETGSTLTVNPNFNGTNGVTTGIRNDQMLDTTAANRLRPNDSAEIQVVISVAKLIDPDANGPLLFGEYENLVAVSNQDQGGGSYSDEDDVLTPQLTPNAMVEVTKMAEALSEDTVRFTIELHNMGNSLAEHVSLVDDLDAVFGAGNYQFVSMQMSTIPSDPDSSLSHNVNYDGSGGITVGVPDNEMLNSLVNNTLDVDDRASFEVIVTVSSFVDQDGPGGMDLGDYLNTAIVENEDPVGNEYTDQAEGQVEFPPNATVGVAKQADWDDETDSGTYTFHLEHFGNTPALNLSMVENLDTIFGSDNWSLTSGPTRLSGPTTIVPNSSYDGTTNADLLDSSSTLNPGETATIQISLMVHNIEDQGHGLGSYLNQVTLTGEDSDGGVYQDDSVTGSDPDPDGDGDPVEETGTPIMLTPDGTVGVAKEATVAEDGSGVVFDFYLEHLGNTPVEVTLIENLAETFTIGTFNVESVTYVEGAAAVHANGMFDGRTETSLLTAGSMMFPGERAHVQVVVSLEGVFGLLNNQATVTATDGEGGTNVDQSQTGTNTDPDGDGDPTNNDVPTTFVIATGRIDGSSYIDTNNNGIFDEGERPIPGVEIVLTGTDVFGNPVSITTYTNEDGEYRFMDLMPGDYTITQVHPEAFIDGIDTPGTGGTLAGNDELSVSLTPLNPTSENNNFGELGVDPRYDGKDPFLASNYGANIGPTLTPPRGLQEMDIQGMATVTIVGDTLTIEGTEQDDSVELAARENKYFVRINQVDYEYEAGAISKIRFHGGAGHDAVKLHGSQQDERVELLPHRGFLRGDGYEFLVENAERIQAYGGGGRDTGFLVDSAGNDVFVVTETFATMRALGNSYQNELFGFSLVTGNAILGGVDQATIYDTSADDRLNITPGFAQLIGGPREFRAAGFESVTAHAISIGDDRVEFRDSAGDDLFEAGPQSSSWISDGYRSVVNKFEQVRGVSQRGGQDVVNFHDSQGDDAFTAAANESSMQGDGFTNIAVGFTTVNAYATAGGYDAAALHDTSGNDVFVGRPDISQISGEGYIHRALGFDVVSGYANAGGNDSAYLYDGEGDDVFIARPNYSELRGDGFQNRVSNFENVVGKAEGEGQDIAIFYDGQSNDTFTSRQTRSEMSDGSYHNIADSFERVQAISSQGSDTAEFVEVDQTETLSAAGNTARVNGKRETMARGFDSVRATSSHRAAKSIIDTVDFFYEQFGEWNN